MANGARFGSGLGGNPLSADEARDRYELLAASGRDIILFIRVDDGRILEANAAAERAYGYTAEELRGLNILDLRAPETRAAAARQLDQADAGGITFETVHRRRDGTTFPVEVSSQGGTLGGTRVVASVLRDISERKALEAQRAAALAKLEAVHQAVADGIAVVDPAGNVVLVNEALVRINGYASAGEMTRDLAYFAENYELSHLDGRPLPVSEWPVSHVLRGESITDWELRGRRKDIGREWTFSFSGQPILDERGEVSLAVIVTRDVTSRTRAERALREGEARMRLLVEHTPAAVAMFDRQMRYLAVSRRFASDLRIDGRDLVGRCHYDVFPEIPERWRDIHRRCLAGAVETCDEEPFPRPDGTVDWVRWQIHPWRDAGGAIGGIILFSEVITERKLAAEKLAAERERLAVTLQSIGDAVIATDRDSRVTLFNGVAEKLTGWAAAEAVGRPLEEVFRIVDEETRLPVASPVTKVLADGAIVGLANHTALIARDGSERPIADSGAPILDAAGAIGGVVLVFRDQTEERRAGEALRKSEALLRTFSEALSDPIFMKDLEGRVLLANPASLRVVGKPAEQILGRTDLEIWEGNPIGRAIVEDDRRIMERGVAEVIEETVQTSSGTTVYLTTKVPFRDAAGRVAGIVGAARDISDRKRVESELRDRDYLLSESQRIAHIGTGSWDLGTGAMRWSDEAYRIFGLPSSQALTPERFLELVHPDDRQALLAWSQACIAGEAPGDLELRIVRPDGSVRVLRGRGELIAGTGGAAARVNGTVQDVTARKRAEERFRALIEHSTDMLLVTDAEMRITFWSHSATTQLGFTADEMLGRRASSILHPDDLALSREQFRGLLEKPGATLRFSRRAVHKDGSLRLIDGVARNLLDDPAVEGVVTHLRDVTAERQLEEQYRQAQKLESIGRLAGGVAHDFNNLLTVILGYAHGLGDDVARGKPARLEDIQEIVAAGDRASDLTGQLLAFARKQVIAPVALDLGASVRGSEKLLRRVLGEDLELLVIRRPGLWLVCCDPGQVEQVIVNLAVNARDAMPRGGTITIATDNVRVDEEQVTRHPEEKPGEYVRLSVSDTGEGMADEVKAHLFEPFFTTKATGQGTGLGLATVYGIVKQSGGHIRVDSAPGRGTTFEVFFPRTHEAAVSAAPPPAAQTGGTEQLLVVEDDPQVRTVTVRALRAGGYQVQVAESPHRALAMPPEELGRVQLLVTDVVMPGMDGRALADELRRRHPALRVLFVSGYTQDVIAERGVLDSEIELLPKPFTAQALLARVRAILDA